MNALIKVYLRPVTARYNDVSMTWEKGTFWEVKAAGGDYVRYSGPYRSRLVAKIAGRFAARKIHRKQIKDTRYNLKRARSDLARKQLETGKWQLI